MKILFLLRSFDYGGAERQLVLLSKGLQKRGHEVVVAVFYSGGPLEKELSNGGVPIRPLDKRGRWDVLGFLFRLAQVWREERPDILHSYLVGSNLLAVILKPLFPNTKVVWGVRCSKLDFSHYDWLVWVSFKLSCRLARFADCIIANSQAGRDDHACQGYPSEKMIVIPNGIDTERFCPDAEARNRIRSEWGVAENEMLIGLVARLDPMKDHSTFLKAAALLKQERTRVRFVCVGDGPQHYRQTLQQLAESLGTTERLIWARSRDDMPGVFNALDMAISSSSYGEGFSNVIGEAMACGVPCVVTDVGDSAWVVGDRGEVVSPGDPVALKNAIGRLLDRRPYTSDQIRLRIVERLSAAALVLNTERMLGELSCTSATSSGASLQRNT